MYLKAIAECAVETQADIRKRVVKSWFANELAQCNEAVMKAELQRFRPFVDMFSGAIQQWSNGLPFNIARVPGEERSHRQMWWDMCKTFGVDITLEDPDLSVRDGVRMLCERLERSPAQRAFAFFFGTECFAVELSKFLFKESSLYQYLGWFAAHGVEHPDRLTHEDIFTMASMAYSERLDLDLFRYDAIQTVDTFIELANVAPMAEPLTAELL